VNHFAGFSVSHALFLLCAPLIAGALNALAAGGSFVTFPALLFLGMPPVNANAPDLHGPKSATGDLSLTENGAPGIRHSGR
jgi:hypothetical protein